MTTYHLLPTCVALILAVGACHRGSTEAPAPETSASPAPPLEDVAGDAPPRIIAIGDLHGDLASAREAFALAGVIGADGAWIGGETIVVQVGDQTDRGDDEFEILEWLDDLRDQAAAAGGAVHVLLGNHEVMNVQLDLRYVTPGGYEDWAATPFDVSDPLFARVAPPQRGRVAAFRPGGPEALRLAEHPMVLVLDQTVFVHGGLEPAFAALGVDEINATVAAWMRGEGPPPSAIQGEDTPIWSRDYSSDTDAADCAALERSLAALDAQRMVVGHTVQRDGITSACDGRVWRVDVGLSDYYGGPTEVLEIVGDRVTVLRQDGL